MSLLVRCPACGLESDEIRCPRCNTLKVMGCDGSCSACRAGCEDGHFPSPPDRTSPRLPAEEGQSTSVRAKR